MKNYQSSYSKLSGSDYKEVKKKAIFFFEKTSISTRRKPYVKSVYFNKQKIFLNVFWDHLNQKNRKQKTIRLKFFCCAIDLIKHSRIEPSIKIDPNNKNEILYRFLGSTRNREFFIVQIKERRKSNKKYLMSIFPYK